MKTEPRLLGTARILLLLTALISAVSAARGDDAADESKKTIKLAAVDRQAMRSPSAPPDGAWTLRNESGQEIQAHLLSAHGETVKIQRVDDDRKFDVPISMFDAYTADRIRNWIKDDPAAVEYAISISAQRNLVDSNEFLYTGKSFKNSKWVYLVTVTNQTRNDLIDATVEYRIVYDDHVEFVRTTPAPGKGVNQQEGQAVDLPDMTFNDQIEFQTAPVETQTYEYDPSRGEREYSRDSIKGIWVRVRRNDQVIAEYKSNVASMGSLSWDNEDEIEIKVTNKFRDSFSEGK